MIGDLEKIKESIDWNLRVSKQLVGHIDLIESYQYSGYSLKQIAQALGMEPNKFYCSLRHAKALRVKHDDQVMLTSVPIKKQSNTDHSKSIQTSENSTDLKKGEQIEQQEDKQLTWKERVERSMKPSNYLHRFNLELEHK